MKKTRKLALILVMALVILPLTGCLDELAHMEEDFLALEERAEAIEDRMDKIMDQLTSEEGMIFDQRMEAALAGLEESFEARMEDIFEGAVTLDDLAMMNDAELMALLEDMDLSLIVELMNDLLDDVIHAMDEVEHDLLPLRQTIRLYIDEWNARLNGRVTALDQPPVIMNERTLVPLRFIGEALGAGIDWEPASRQVTYTLKGKTIQLTIDSQEALVNGTAATLEVAPVIVNDRTLVPARFVSETLGYDVEWDGTKRMVVISTSITPPAVSYRQGVVVGTDMVDGTPVITLLTNGNEIHFKADETLYWEVMADWDYYSHWGLFQAGLSQDMTLVSLEYLEGVEDYIGVFADFYAEKSLADVLAVEDLTVTFVGVEYLLDSDDPEDLPGFDTMINTQLTPENGETILLSEEIVVYVEGDDGIFQVGEVADIQGDAYDYVEFYDTDGDLVYDIVIVWLI